MSAIHSLPGRLSALVAAVADSPGPVQVVAGSRVQCDLLARVCRECGVPLSPVISARSESAAVRDVTSGTTLGYVTASGEPLSPGVRIIRFRDLSPASAIHPRIPPILAEHARAGVELPALAVWPWGSRLPAGSRLQPGRALADRRDLGVGEDVAACLDGPDGSFPVELRRPCADLLTSWQQLHGRTAVDAVVAAPMPNHPMLSAHVATGVASLLGVPYAGELAGNRPPVGPEDARTRVRRLAAQLRLDPARVDVSRVAGRHVLLVGLEWTEGWTLTVSGQLLLSAGALTVRPFTLSSDIRQARR